jgi:predicted TIM-barrel fold metal-dependent hydrolase
MSEHAPACLPPDPVTRGATRFTVPEGAVDTHAHIIGDPPFIESRSYTPPPAPPEAYLAMLDATGMRFGVLVQPSVHGTDNTLLIETLRAHRDRLRGIGVTPWDTPEDQLREMKAAGIVGLRLNTLFGGGIGLADLDRYEAVCAELGWHLQFLTDARALGPHADRLKRLRVPFVIDHMGHFPVGEGLDSIGAKVMLDLVRGGGEAAKGSSGDSRWKGSGGWVKLSGAYRIAAPPYTETIPLARALIEAAPGRCLWGSDWPHVSQTEFMPNPGDLLDLLADWAPDPSMRQRILVDNPHRLYGF